MFQEQLHVRVFCCFYKKSFSACVTCQKVYDTDCVGYVSGKPWCATSASASVSYSIGFIYYAPRTSTSYYNDMGEYVEETSDYTDSGACRWALLSMTWTILCFLRLNFACPAGTTLQIDVASGSVPSDPNNYNTGYCTEYGDDAGQWFYGQWLLTDFDPVPMSSFRCVGWLL